MKTCTKCLVPQELSGFAKNGKNGLHTYCKACHRNQERERRLRNPAAAKARDKEQYQAHKTAKRESNKAYCLRVRATRLEVERKRYADNADARKLAAREYRKLNASKVYALNGKRRANQGRATPAWADMRAIEDIYSIARIYSEATGIKFHVDHYYPLQGKNVCGLHVESNLRVIPASENLAKGSRVPSDA